ncbi:MAG TPA: glycosyltransferase, partial [Candidatus Limnocylindrales bacterium]|nr:glycosyltransferase [Candidatus Limnocylindrales bacterium]
MSRPGSRDFTESDPTGLRPLRIAYLMSRFPKATETFVLNEILELERLGHRVSIHPLVIEREPVDHPGVGRLLASIARPTPRRILEAQVYWLRRRPAAYVGTWVGAVRGNLRSPRFLVRSLATVPVAAWFARDLANRAPGEPQVDHVHAHWATHPTLAAWVVRRLTGIPYSFTGHAHDLFVDRSMLREKMAEAAFAVTISDYNRRFLERRLGRLAADRVVVIHCGVDPEVFAPPESGPAATDDAASGASSPGRVVVVASLQPQKGHLVLVDALAALARDRVSFEAWLVGEGPERAAIEQAIARHGLGDGVRLLGTLGRDRVAAEIRAADVVVQPSIVLPSGKTEGIPVALMEALAAERAVVATDVAGVSELVRDGETGLLVRSGDADALAGAIGRLLGDPDLRARLGRAGRALVLREFD